MRIVPVVDLLEGQVVHAVQGNRHAYRPIVSALCSGAEPGLVARTLLHHCNARSLYLADLDALLGRAPQTGVLRKLLQLLPQAALWLDAGFADRAAADALLKALGAHAGRVVPVFGSESLRSPAALEGCFAAGPDSGILSLDRRAGRELDAAGCWASPELWPRRVIVMTLERVGTDAGPDLATLARVRAQAPAATLIGAGGIRDAADLQAAGHAGADAWLVASALHAGRLERAVA